MSSFGSQGSPVEEEPELELRPPVEVLVVVSSVVEVCESPDEEDDDEEDEEDVLVSPPELADVVPVVVVAPAVVKPEPWLIELSLSELLGLQAKRPAAIKSARGEWR